MATSVLEALGDTSSNAKAMVRRFRQHDEATFNAQYAVKDDENKFVSTTRAAASQLEQLFAADETKSE